MTQNGPPQGQPWSDGGSDEPYREPSDPWGGNWGGNPTSTTSDTATDFGTTMGGYPTAPQFGAGPDPTGLSPTGLSPTGVQPPGVQATGVQPMGMQSTAWPPPGMPTPGPRRNGPIVAVVVVLGLLICGGLGTTAWLLIDRAANERKDAATATTTPAPGRTTAVTGQDPRPQDSQNARFVAKGQCVRNEGTADKPQMQIVPCASGSYEVLARVDGRTTGEADAETKCAKVPRYTKWYFYNSDLDSLDFVLCLRER
jgi:hypothetical protein